MYKLSIVIAIVAMLAMTGCMGMITKGSTELITINSEPSGALVAVDGVESGETPLMVSMQRSESHVVRVSKEGYYDATFQIARKTDGGIIVLDILLTGGIGLLIDMSAGGIYDLDPDQIEASLDAVASVDGHNINVSLRAH
jgi:hypothetical protein